MHIRNGTVLAFIVAVVTARLGIGSAWAGGSIGTSVTGGNNYSMVQVDAEVDITPSWSTSLSMSQEQSHIDYSAQNRQISLRTSVGLDEANGVRGGFLYSNDTNNAIEYMGPNFGYGYVINDAPKGEGESAEEVLSFYLDAEMLFYRAQIMTPSAVLRSRVRDGQLNLDPVQMTQFHPTLEIDKPLLSGGLVLFGLVGHYFYSTDPTEADAIVASDPILSSTGAQWMLGGFPENNWSAGVVVKPTSKSTIRTDFGGYRSAVSDVSSGFWGVTGGYTFLDSWRTKFGYSHSRSFSGNHYDFVVAGLSYLF